jgi:hypothetical protein
MRHPRLGSTIAVLASGQLFVYGGYNPTVDPMTVDNTVELFDPDTGDCVVYPGPPEWDDAPPLSTRVVTRNPMSCVLADGTVLVAKMLWSDDPVAGGFVTAIFDPSDHSWQSAERGGHFVWRNTVHHDGTATSWTLLPDGTVLAFAFADGAGGTVTSGVHVTGVSQRYLPGAHGWTAPSAEANPPGQNTVNQWPDWSSVVLLPPAPSPAAPHPSPSGRVLVFVGNFEPEPDGVPDSVVVYTPNPDPTRAGTYGAPVHVLGPGGRHLFGVSMATRIVPGGQVLWAVTDTIRSSTSATQFAAFDPVTNAVTILDSPDSCAHEGNMLLLPSGDILYNRLENRQQVAVFSPGADSPYQLPEHAWRPQITSFPRIVEPSGDYPLTGTQLTGLTQATTSPGQIFCPTNYPLVFLRHRTTRKVWCCPTHDHTSMGVGVGAHVTTHFRVPLDYVRGPSDMWVVTNGIPSAYVSVNDDPIGNVPDPDRRAILILAGNLADGNLIVLGPGPVHRVPPFNPELLGAADALRQRIAGDLQELQLLLPVLEDSESSTADTSLAPRERARDDEQAPSPQSMVQSIVQSPSPLPILVSLLGLLLVVAAASAALLVVPLTSDAALPPATPELVAAVVLGLALGLVGLARAARQLL